MWDFIQKIKIRIKWHFRFGRRRLRASVEFVAHMFRSVSTTTVVVVTVISMLTPAIFLDWFGGGGVFAASQGPRTANASGDCTSTGTGGTVSWSTPGNAFSSNDSWATSGSLSGGNTTHYLRCLNYGFTIPSGSTIDGIIVDIERKCSGTACTDSDVFLTKNGTATVGTDRATATQYTTSDVTESHGTGTTDMWGTTWTTSEINASTFGVYYNATKPGGGGRTVTVDVISITVHYTVNPTFQQSSYRWFENQDSSQITAWTLGGSGNETATAFAHTSDGGFATAGVTTTFGGELMVVSKFNSSFVEQWTRTVPGTGSIAVTALTETTDDGIVVVGTTDLGVSQANIWVVKFTSSGTLSWNNLLDSSSTIDQAFGVDATSAGGVVITGDYDGSEGGPFPLLPVIVLDSSGNLDIACEIGSAGATTNIGQDVIQTSDGGFAVVGQLESNQDSTLYKFDDLCEIEWTTTFDGSANFYEGMSVIQTDDDGYTITGETSSGTLLLLVRIDSAGDHVWTKTTPAANSTLGYAGKDVIATSDGGYAVAGSINSHGAGSTDVMLSKFNDLGEEQWTTTFGTTSAETAYGLAQTSDDGFVVAGSTAGFGAGGTDMLLVKFNSSGQISGCGAHCSSLSISETNQSPTITHPTPTADAISPSSSSGSSATAQSWTEDQIGTLADVADPLNGVSQDTATTAPPEGIPFRLRMTLHVTDANAASGSFKLQYAARGVDDLCDTSFSGESYNDITSSTPIAYYDNPGMSDGDVITADANDPAHSGHTNVYQNYNEANNASVSSTINIGQDGLWDFALTDNGAPSSTAYCFKLVTSAGADLGTTPVVVPMITTLPPDFNQANYRWFLGQDAVSSNTFVQALSGGDTDMFMGVVNTLDGGYAAVGRTSLGAGVWDLLLTKYDSTGVEVWSKSLGESASNNTTNFIQTPDGGFVVVGGTDNYGAAGSSDMLITRFNSSGEEQWTKTLGGSGSDTAKDVVRTSDGGYVVVGNTSSTGLTAGGNDLILVKLNSSGEEQWTKTVGGANDDEGNAVIQTPDGGYAVAGYTTGFGTTSGDLLLVKFSSSGVEQWTKTFGDTGLDSASDLVLASDGGFVVAGNTSSFGGTGGDGLLVKFDPDGVEQWTTLAGIEDAESLTSVVKAADGGYIAVGTSFDDLVADDGGLWLVKFDSSGERVWDEVFGGLFGASGNSVVETPDGGFAAVGSTSSYGAGTTSSWFIKTDASGQVDGCPSTVCTGSLVPTDNMANASEANQSASETDRSLTEADETDTEVDETSNTTAAIQAGYTSFAVTLGGSNSDSGLDIVQTSDGGYAVSGTSNSIGVGDNDSFLSRFDPLGVELWSTSRGELTSTDSGSSVAAASDGGFVVAGRTQSAGGGDFWIVKYDSSGAESWTRSWGTASSESGNGIVRTSDNGYIIGGTSGSELILSKLSSAGGEEWTRTYGSTGTEQGNDVAQTSDGGYVIIGSTTSFSISPSDIILTKVDSTGVEEWTKTIGGSGADAGNAVIQTSDGGYAVTGTTSTTGSTGDVWLIKFDSSGVEQWSKTVNGGGADAGRSLVQTNDGGYIVAGTFDASVSGLLALIKFDSSGVEQWTKTVAGSGNEAGNSVIQTSDGGYAVAGTTSSFGVSGNDQLIVKFGAAGETPGCSSECAFQSLTESNQDISETDRSLTESAELGMITADETNSEITGALTQVYQAPLGLWTETGPIPSFPIGSQDSAGASSRYDDPLRLRFSLLATKGASLGSADVKLQVAARVGGTCETDFSGGESYADISGSAAFNYYDNTNLADGDWVLSGGYDPAVTSGNMWYENYEESAPFTNRHHIGGPGMPNYGLWDASLTTTANALYGNYCFRVVYDDNNLLNDYDRIFELSIPPAPSQQMRHGRFFDTNTGTSQPYYW